MAVLLATCALAGHSSVSFAGGNVHVTDSEPPCAEDFPFQTAWSTRSGAGITGVCGTPPGLPGAGTADCTGTLTATFSFVPAFLGEKPPPYAVVYELSEASYEGDTGSCANGLGHPAVPPVGFAKTSMGERWTLRTNPGTSFSVSVTPWASSAWTTGVCGESEGEASVSYTAGCYPVYVQLGGTLYVSSSSQSGHECMIGQQVVATLVCLSWPDSTRSWSLDGVNAFADYQAAPPTGDVSFLGGSHSGGLAGSPRRVPFRRPERLGRALPPAWYSRGKGNIHGRHSDSTHPRALL
ncbi:MAG: hypothetical protein AB7F50_09485 [Fimbriimonadaceae bacterium]